MSARSHVVMFLIAALVTAPMASAQHAVLIGTVLVDSAERPVSRAEIFVPGLRRAVLSDSTGAFRIDGLPAGTYSIVVRVAGYVPLERALTFAATDTLERDFVLLARTPAPTLAAANMTARSPAVRRGRGDYVSSEELRQTPSSNLLEALKRVRPNFLRIREPSTTIHPISGLPTKISPVQRDSMARANKENGVREPIVYLNGVRIGTLDALASLSVDDILEVQFLSSSEATLRFGTGHTNGALLVTQGAK